MQEPVPAILIHWWSLVCSEQLRSCTLEVEQVECKRRRASQLSIASSILIQLRQAETIWDCSAEDTPFVPIPSPAPWAIEEACMKLHESRVPVTSTDWCGFRALCPDKSWHVGLCYSSFKLSLFLIFWKFLTFHQSFKTISSMVKWKCSTLHSATIWPAVLSPKDYSEEDVEDLGRFLCELLTSRHYRQVLPRWTCLNEYASYAHIWSYLIIFDHIWSYLIIFDHIWSYLIIFDHICTLVELVPYIHVSSLWFVVLFVLSVFSEPPRGGMSRFTLFQKLNARWHSWHMEWIDRCFAVSCSIFHVDFIRN